MTNPFSGQPRFSKDVVDSMNSVDALEVAGGSTPESIIESLAGFADGTTFMTIHETSAGTDTLNIRKSPDGDGSGHTDIVDPLGTFVSSQNGNPLKAQGTEVFTTTGNGAYFAYDAFGSLQRSYDLGPGSSTNKTLALNFTSDGGIVWVGTFTLSTHQLLLNGFVPSSSNSIIVPHYIVGPDSNSYLFLLRLSSSNVLTFFALCDESFVEAATVPATAVTVRSIASFGGSERLLLRDSSSAAIQAYSGGEQGTPDSNFAPDANSDAMDMDGGGSIYVAVGSSFTVKKYNTSGTLLNTFGSEGEELGEFIYGPTTLSIIDGDIYAVDSNLSKSRVVVMAATDGTGLQEWTYQDIAKTTFFAYYTSSADKEQLSGGIDIDVNALFDGPNVREMAAVAANHVTDVRTAIRRLLRKKPYVGFARNCIQVVTVTSGTGNFTLTFDGQTTGNIAHDASAATVDAALEALSNIDAGDVAVAGSDGGPWSVTFQSSLGSSDVSTLIAASGDGVVIKIVKTVVGVSAGSARLNWLSLDANNAYFRGMGDRDSYGSLVTAYDWERGEGALDDQITFDIDVGELAGVLIELSNATF